MNKIIISYYSCQFCGLWISGTDDFTNSRLIRTPRSWCMKSLSKKPMWLELISLLDRWSSLHWDNTVLLLVWRGGKGFWERTVVSTFGFELVPANMQAQHRPPSSVWLLQLDWAVNRTEATKTNSLLMIFSSVFTPKGDKLSCLFNIIVKCV